MERGILRKALLSLSASAGSGKTFALVARYLSLLFLEVKASEILAITFTNKAAREMEERVLSSLLDMQPQMREVIAAETGFGEQDIERLAPKVLDRFLRSEPAIMTIDRFVNRILGKFCWYVGVGSDYEVSPADSGSFFGSFLETLSDREYEKIVAFAKEESQRGRKIADFFEILYEKDKELPPFRASDIRCDEDAILSKAREISDYMLSSSLGERGKKTMRFENFSELMAKSWIARDSLNYWDYKKVYTPDLDRILIELKALIAVCYRAREKHFLKNIYELYASYRESKLAAIARSGVLHFRDIEHFVYSLLREREDMMDFIRFRLDSSISHILFDEFQDTSVTQFRIFEPFIEEAAASPGSRSFFYVGDTKQSIYRFRGGRKELFEHVAKRFDIPVEYLDRNYRSAGEIVGFVNRIFPYVQPPQKAVREGGFVEVLPCAVDELLEKMGDTLATLFAAGARESDIAILVHDNREILEVGEYIESRFAKRIKTHKRALVKERSSAKILIEILRALHARRYGRDDALHRLNVLALLGKPWREEFALSFDANLPPASIVKEAMDIYGLYDEAALKLLEFSMGCRGVEEFVMDIESYEEELPPSLVEGINVLTIHKSKGLEFPHLIVLDRMGRARHDSSPVIFDYEGIELLALRMKFEKREAVDPEYARVLEKERALAAEDEMNRNYVAFTRARDSLHILFREKSSSFAALSLEEEKIGTLRIESVQESRREALPEVKMRWRDYGRQEKRTEAAEYSANDREAIYFGKAVHYLLEAEDEDSLLNRYGLLCDTDKAVDMARKALGNEAFAALCRGRIHRELPYVEKGRLRVIDLLIESEKEAIVVDYKSVTPHDESSYKRQLKAYSEAVRSFTESAVVRAFIYYLDSRTLVEI